VNKDQGVLTITLFNPERRNAIGPQMANEILYALEDAKEDAEVRSVVLTGEGKAFCSGGDFAAMTGGEGTALPVKGDYAVVLLAMVRAEKPIVARVNGLAMGGGFGLVAASTFAVAAEDVVFGTPEINVGLFPMMIMAVLARFVPRRRLMKMMLLGEKIDAREALALGVLNEVTSDLDGAVKKITDGVASKSPITVKLGMRAFAAQDDLELEKALPMLRDRLAECLGTDDAREGLMAFLEKRAPKWTGT
jgi:enoyl-CoA hydratase/carnithine racemase